MTLVRRTLLKNAATLVAAYTATGFQYANSAQTQRQFKPQPGDWRTYEVTTRVDVQQAEGATRVWLPVPSVNTDWQQSLESSVQSNGQSRMLSDSNYGARMLALEFAPGEARPWVELTTRVRTRSRAVDWARKQPVRMDAASLKFWTEPTDLLPTDGIVHKTALQATRGATTDVEKARAIYDWVVANTFREPTVKGCGEGDIKFMLETNNLGGKCADINAVFVGLCRAAGLPARDVYGLRLSPSEFGYKQLGGNPASLQGAQHCRAEVFLKDYGWAAMDPADVTKVMRHEAPQWVKNTSDPLVAPVNEALFGGWEGNWVAWNMAHDVSLPGSTGPKLGFLMYPMAETAGERLDHYSPDAFKYQIRAREITS